MALFSNQRAAHAASTNLVEFPAGRCALQAATDGSTDSRQVVAQPAKGTLFMHQTDDMLMRFCWKNRDTGQVVDDLIIFPGDAIFIRVKECTDGRVYLLKFKNSELDRWFFYWMQDEDTSKDEDRARRVSQLLNNPPAAGAGAAAAGAGGARAGAGGLPEELASMSQVLRLPDDAYGQLDQQQLQQLLAAMSDGSILPAGLPEGLFGSGAATQTPQIRPQSGNAIAPGAPGRARRTVAAAAGSEPTAATPSTGGTAAAGAAAGSEQTPRPGAGQQTPVQLADLQSLLANISVPPGGSGEGAQAEHPTPSGKVFLNGSHVPQSRLAEHLPHEPPVVDRQAELDATLHSAQFRQAANAFGVALQTGQMAPVLQQFGLPTQVVDAAKNGDLSEVAVALEQVESAGAAKSESTGSSTTTCTCTADTLLTTTASTGELTAASGTTTATTKTTDTGSGSTGGTAEQSSSQDTTSGALEPEPKRTKTGGPQNEGDDADDMDVA